MIPFAKYSGAGNDFLILEAGPVGDDPGRLARRMCRRRAGAGADGVALVTLEDDGVLGVRFFNPDGSEFGTCGNGSRCVARWASDRGAAVDGRVRLRTAEGVLDARVDGDRTRLDYRLPCRVLGRRAVPIGDESREGWLVEMGTPHLVVPVDRMPEGPLENLCRPAREAPSLGPEGANVNLVELRAEGRAAIRTYERGVEGETMACGAGSMSVAFALRAAGRAGRRLELEARGGVLAVELAAAAVRAPSEEREREIRLAGPARPVYEGRFFEDGDADDDGRGA